MPRIRFQITGSQSDEEDVRLNDLISTLTSIQAALKHTEKIVRESDSARGYYRVTNLSRNSPTVFEIEMVVPPRKKDNVDASTIEEETVSRFFENIDDILKEQRPPGMGVTDLQAYSAIGTVLDKNVSRLVVWNADRELDLSTTYRTNISEIIGRETSAYGVIRGVLERLNVHGKRNRFYIYPDIGPLSVACEFRNSLQSSVVSAVTRYVEVCGSMHYKRNAKHPYLIDADKLTILPAPENLPTLWSLRGIAPEATGKLSAVEFVESIRE